MGMFFDFVEVERQIAAQKRLAMTELGAYRHTLLGGHNQSYKGEIERTKEFTKRTREVPLIRHQSKNCGV